MTLRKLEMKDAPFMLEWMHDPNVTIGLQKKFGEKTLADCEEFIASANRTSLDIHMAVADDNDEYMGTVSLKNISNGSAEFAVAVRSCAMGKGFSRFAMAEIIRIGFEELGLENIYWYVLKDNLRAIKFYDKNGYVRINEFLKKDKSFLEYAPFLCAVEHSESFIWYLAENHCHN